MPGPKPHAAGEEAGEDRGDSDSGQHGGGLTYLDLFAILSAGSLGGRNGFTLQQFAELSDRQLIALLSIEWDEDGRLVTESARGRSGRLAPSGSIAAAGRELPSPEMLGLSEREIREALCVKPNVDERYLSMFWSVWKRRGKSNDEIRSLWDAHLASEN